MPPRPFPFTLSIGTDICHIPRIEALLLKDRGRYADRFIKKLLNPLETKELKGRLGVLDELRASNCQNSGEAGERNGVWKRGEERSRVEKENEMSKIRVWDALERKRMWDLAGFLSGRWAAKEAVIKAHTSRRLTMHDITIQRGEEQNGLSTAPVAMVRLRGNGVGEKRDVEVRISISHDGEYATAVCLAAEEV